MGDRFGAIVLATGERVTAQAKEDGRISASNGFEYSENELFAIPEGCECAQCWLARDADGYVYMHTSEPPRKRGETWDGFGDKTYIGYDLFPEISWEDESPVRMLMAISPYPSADGAIVPITSLKQSS